VFDAAHFAPNKLCTNQRYLHSITANDAGDTKRAY
jgi:hypothetical protein